MWDDFTLVNGVLYRQGSSEDSQLHYVFPLHWHAQVLEYLHRNAAAGHLYVTQTTKAATRCFFWPRMCPDIIRYIVMPQMWDGKAGLGKGKSHLRQEISGTRNERIVFDIIGPLPEYSSKADKRPWVHPDGSTHYIRGTQTSAHNSCFPNRPFCAEKVHCQASSWILHPSQGTPIPWRGIDP